MDSQIFTNVTTVLVAICGIALVAVLVSRNANTAGVIQAGGNAFSTSLLAAVSPVTGNSGGFGGGAALGGIGGGLGGFGGSALLA